jgi:putative transposase
MDTSIMKQLEELEDKSRRLKKLYDEEPLKSNLRQKTFEREC